MPSKCDNQLEWWISLANLHKAALPSVGHARAGTKGFAEQVRKLKGPRPEGVGILLEPSDPLNDRLIGWGNDPDQCLWGIAGVANSVLSKLAGLGEAWGPSKEIVVADRSTFTAPLLLSVSAAGKVEQAYRPEPLANDLLSVVRGKNVAAIGICPMCEKFFQRLRRDQKCDNRRCRDAYRQRLFRVRHRQYEANRRRYRKEGIRAKELIKLSATLRRGLEKPPK
jgi:hypothetical protein